MATIDSKYKYFFDPIVVTKKMRTSLLAARVLILPLLVTSAQAGEVSLAWGPSISPSVGGYRVYHGQISGDYTTSQDVGNKLTHTVKGLQDGAVYYFAVTAYDLTKNVESNFSNEVSSLVENTYSLTVGKAGTGSGTVTGSGINCGVDCSELYTAGMTVTLTAAAATGSIFNGWSGSCLGTGACHLTMNAVRNVAATFRLETLKKTQTVGLYAPVTGIFFLSNSHDGGAADFTFRYGPADSGWIPLVGDWDELDQ